MPTRAAGRRLMEIANGIEAVQGVIHIEKVNAPMLYKDGATPAGILGRVAARHRQGLAEVS